MPSEFDVVFDAALSPEDRELFWCCRISGGVDPMENLTVPDVDEWPPD